MHVSDMEILKRVKVGHGSHFNNINTFEFIVIFLRNIYFDNNH